MEILIDESGPFVVKGAVNDSWCVVAAYACPGKEKSKLKGVLYDLKSRAKYPKFKEIKLSQISEKNYKKFLIDLNKLNGILLCTATDSSLNHEKMVKIHQFNQAASMKKNIDKMKYESGKKGVECLTSQLENLSVQLYIQLTCQIQLMHSFVTRGINYFVQRDPKSLSSFCWRIDQKDPIGKTDFEDAFEKFSPALLQSLSLREPGHRLSWCDYQPMKAFLYKKGEMPEYLIDKFPLLKNAIGLNIQKIIRKDIQFVDSALHSGIQIVDLLASGLRRLLRQGFQDNSSVAHLLGSLMVQNVNNSPPISLVTFGKEEPIKSELRKLVRILINTCRPMIKKS